MCKQWQHRLLQMRRQYQHFRMQWQLRQHNSQQPPLEFFSFEYLPEQWKSPSSPWLPCALSLLPTLLLVLPQLPLHAEMLKLPAHLEQPMLPLLAHVLESSSLAWTELGAQLIPLLVIAKPLDALPLNAPPQAPQPSLPHSPWLPLLPSSKWNRLEIVPTFLRLYRDDDLIACMIRYWMLRPCEQ